MKSICRKYFDSVKTISLFVVLIMPLDTFSQDMETKATTIPDSVVNNIVNDFFSAVNSGQRKAMRDFITTHYDKNILRRGPISSAISLYLGFYYETGGMGYELLNKLPSGANLITAELYNKLTETKVLFKIPVSGAPSYKIINFIKSNKISPKADEKQGKKLSDDEIIKRIGNSLKKLEADEEFSGAVLVAKNGKILMKKAIGMASKSYEVPNKTDTKFNIASVGKMFTGLAVTQLAEQGKLSFDDSLSMYVSSDWLKPEISKKIQIKHLLTHSSGLGDYFRDAYKQCDIPFFRDLEDYKTLIVDDSLLFEPGTKFSYSNTGYLLLGVVIEKVTNDKYFSYLKKNIFEPAGMVNTDGFDKDSPVKNRATGYSKIYENGKISWNNHQYTRIMRGSPPGGIYSTVEDLFKFDAAIRSDKLLSPEYTKIIMEGRPELNVSFHSYGFFVSEGVAGREAYHKGDGRGTNCQFKSFLDSGYTLIVLSNFSAPSANIVANVVDQLITHNVVKK